MEYDMGFWREWALTIHHNGLANTYNSTINYFPIYVYGLYVYDLLQGTDANIVHNINNIKNKNLRSNIKDKKRRECYFQVVVATNTFDCSNNYLCVAL